MVTHLTSCWSLLFLPGKHCWQLRTTAPALPASQKPSWQLDLCGLCCRTSAPCCSGTCSSLPLPRTCCGVCLRRIASRLLSSPSPSSLGPPAAGLLMSTYLTLQSQRVPLHCNCYLLNNLQIPCFRLRCGCPFLGESPFRLMGCFKLGETVVLGSDWDAVGIQLA